MIEDRRDGDRLKRDDQRRHTAVKDPKKNRHVRDENEKERRIEGRKKGRKKIMNANEKLKKLLANLEEAEKTVNPQKTQKSNYAFLPKGTHLVRILPDSTPKLFASARVHTLKALVASKDKDGNEVLTEKTRSVLCGRGPDGTGDCPICEYANAAYRDGDKSVSWIFARPMMKVALYVHETDATSKFRDVVQWGPRIVTVAAISNRAIQTQLLDIIRSLSKDNAELFRLINYTEEPFYGITIKYPASREITPHVSLDPTSKVPPLKEEDLPEWFTSEDFDLSKVGHVDFTQLPSWEELKEVLESHLLWKREKSGENGLVSDLRSAVSGTKPEAEKAVEKDDGGLVDGETPPWEDEGEIVRTPAKEGDPKPACFGHYVSGETCASCAYFADCIEAMS